MKFHIGDRVVVTNSDKHGWQVGTVLTVESFYTSINGYDCFKAFGKTMGCMVEDVTLESVYNSPLFQALK